MARKASAESELRPRIDADPAKKAAYGDAWDRIAAAQKVAAEIRLRLNFLERGLAFDSQLFSIARTLVRLAEEKAKPNADRLREYRDSALESLKLQLFSDAPIYPEYEKAKLAHSLAYWKKTGGHRRPDGRARPPRPDARAGRRGPGRRHQAGRRLAPQGAGREGADGDRRAPTIR